MEVLLLQQDCIFTIISDVNVFSKREKMSLNRKRAVNQLGNWLSLPATSPDGAVPESPSFNKWGPNMLPNGTALK
ncbi:hypothetical protein ACU8KH_01664 [Lachancea thermotolerans]